MNIINRDDLYKTIYTLDMLHYKGISVGDTIRKSLEYFKEWYLMSGDYRYLELALLQIRAGFELGISAEINNELYSQIFELSSMSIDDMMEKDFFIIRKVKLSKAQIRNVIKKWKPSKINSSTLSEVVEEIYEKLKNKELGNYCYSYEKGQGCGKQRFNIDVYKLIITEDICYLVDIKDFTLYQFE